MLFNKSLQARVLFQILLVVILLVGAIGVFVGVSNRIVANRNAKEYTQLQTKLNAERFRLVVSNIPDLSEYTDSLSILLQKHIDKNWNYTNGVVAYFSNDGRIIAHSAKEYNGKQFSSIYPEVNNNFDVESNIKRGRSIELNYLYEGVDYIAFVEPIFLEKGKPFAVGVSFSKSSLLAAAKKSVLRSVFFALFAVIIMVLVIWRVAASIVKPVRQVTKTLHLLSLGKTTGINEIKLSADDELGEMAESLNKVVAGTRVTENFALEIGKGNLEAEYEHLSDDDQLGDALLEMRKSLQVSKEEETKRKKEEVIRNWSNEGIAKFSEILRNNNNDLKKLGVEFLQNLVKYLNVNQAAIFVLNDDDDIDKPFFEMISAIAFDREKFMKKEIYIGEGLVGRCAYEKKSIYITDVPDDYHEVTSGLGTATPKCVFIVPCVLNDEVYSVIELAAFTPLEKHEIEFVEMLSESIASTISSVRINEKTSTLLANSQKQSEELAAQEEELRQNLEEMEATQEDLQRQMKENAKMRESLKQQNVLLDSLLASLPDYIYFKDKDCKFLRISTSMLDLFGAKTVDEVIGKSDFDYHKPENAQVYYDDEQRIMNAKEGFVNKLQHEIKADGTEMWNTVTKMPLIDEDGNAFGTFGISKDVTDLKNLEIEAQGQKDEANNQRVLLDALLSTLPDFIYFKDKDSKFLRISNSMLSLFNAKSVDEVIGKSDFDFQEKAAAQEYYEDEQRIIENQEGITDKLQREVHIDGSVHWTSVTKLPLLDKDGNAVGTFGISKDVTEIKNLELESKVKNEELQAQEEELRQNLEEMSAVQDDLKKQIELNKKTNQYLAKEKLLLDALMNDLPDYIYFKDKDSKFIRISQSMTSLFGVEDPNDIIGKSDYDFQTPENAQKYFDDEQRIIRTRKGMFDQLQEEKMPDGRVIWNLVTKLPLLDEKGKAVGTFGVSKNITKVMDDK